MRSSNIEMVALKEGNNLMHTIDVRNVQEALPEGIRLLQNVGIHRESRNGPVLVHDGPVTTLYRRPRERVIFWPERDANPFFHFMESLWMLAGRRDVEFVSRYVGSMKQFSDDGKIFHGAYGHRWINHFKHIQDGEQVGYMHQLLTVGTMLKRNPEERRAVVGMWDPETDLAASGKDLPCNTHMYFSINKDGALDMTVCNRSNDIIWGAYGANAVHMSYAQEYVAGVVGCPVGRYWQWSNNYHAYLKTFTPLLKLADEVATPHRLFLDRYSNRLVQPYPLMSTPEQQWREDLALFMEEDVYIGLRDRFFTSVAHPIKMAHLAYKKGSGEERYITALEIIEQCRASDWRLACEQWLTRRLEKHRRAQDDGPTDNG